MLQDHGCSREAIAATALVAALADASKVWHLQDAKAAGAVRAAVNGNEA